MDVACQALDVNSRKASTGAGGAEPNGEVVKNNHEPLHQQDTSLTYVNFDEMKAHYPDDDSNITYGDFETVITNPDYKPDDDFDPERRNVVYSELNAN